MKYIETSFKKLRRVAAPILRSKYNFNQKITHAVLKTIKGREKFLKYIETSFKKFLCGVWGETPTKKSVKKSRLKSGFFL